MFSDIDTKIEELIRKADAAQIAGNNEAMEAYDRQIKILREEKMKLLKSISSDAGEEKKPRTK